MRKTILIVCMLTGILSTTEAQQPSQPAKIPVNIVLFVADDLAADDIGPYGNSVVRTPHIDQLAAESLM